MTVDPILETKQKIVVSSLPQRPEKSEKHKGKQVFPAAMYTGSLPCCRS